LSVYCLTVGCMKDRIFGRAQNFGETAKTALIEASGVNSRSFYDPKSGLFFAVLLSFFLWWIPYLGQMIPGYVCGRRAGSIKNGLISVVVASIILIISTAIISGLLSIMFMEGNTAFINTFGGMTNGIIVGIYDFTNYLASFATISNGGLYVNVNAFAMLIAFGVVGGVMSDQSRKEIRIIVGQTMSASDPELPRSVRVATGETKVFETYSDYSAIRVNRTEAPAKPQKAPRKSHVIASATNTDIPASYAPGPVNTVTSPATSTEVTYSKIPVTGATPSSSASETKTYVMPEATTVAAETPAVHTVTEVPASAVQAPAVKTVSSPAVEKKVEESEDSVPKRSSSDDLEWF